MNGDEVKVFVEGQSPSEKNKTMKDLLLERYTEESLPANIIVAEQRDGKNAGNTIDYLIKNKYNLAFFVIQNPTQFNKTHWDYNLNSEPSISDLDKRAEDIRAIF